MPLASRIGRLLALALAAALSLALAPACHAQGTSGQLPDPISAIELSKLLRNYVHPSKEQLASIETLHDGYRDRFRALRESDIEKFMLKMKEMQGGMPNKAQVEEFTKGYERINKQISDIDDSFFDAIATLMGDERRPAVQRARDTRSRTCALAGIMTGMMAQGGPVDLSAIVLEMGLDPKELEALQPTLITYEQRLTAATKDLSQAAMRMMRDMFDELEKAGFANISQEDMIANPEKMAGMMEALQAAMAKAGERFQAKSKDLREFNGKNFRALEEQIAGEGKRKFRVRYVKQAYPEIAADPADAEQLFRMALRIKTLTPEAKEAVTNAYTQWQRSDSAVVEQLMKTVDEFRSRMSMMDFSGGNGEYAQKIAELTTKRGEIGTAALQSISSQLGDERMQKLIAKKKAELEDLFADADDPEADPGSAEATEGVPGIGVRAQEMKEAMVSFNSTMDRDPIAGAAVTAIATQLSLDDSRKTLLEVMHSDYLKRWEEEIRVFQKRVEDAQAARWSQDGEDGNMKLVAAQQAAYFDARRALLAKATELDAAFFHDAVSALGDESAAVLQLAKLERVLDRTAAGDPYNSVGFMIGPAQAPVNFVAVLRSADLSTEDRAKVRVALVEKADSLCKLHLDARSVAIDQEREMEEVGQRNMTLYNGGENPDMVEIQKAGVAMMALQQRRAETSARCAEASQAAWTAALATLAEAQRAPLQLAYDERAYPTIFKDPRSATAFVAKARALRDLSDEQRQKLQALDERYGAEHVDYCRKMIPKKAPTASPERPEDMQRYWQEEMELANAREKIRFDRDEHSQRAISQLRRILNDAQVAQIAGLADYEKAAPTKSAGPFGQLE